MIARESPSSSASARSSSRRRAATRGPTAPYGTVATLLGLLGRPNEIDDPLAYPPRAEDAHRAAVAAAREAWDLGAAAAARVRRSGRGAVAAVGDVTAYFTALGLATAAGLNAWVPLLASGCSRSYTDLIDLERLVDGARATRRS